MTFACYVRLRNRSRRPCRLAALARLKIRQDAITLPVFVPLVLCDMQQALKPDDLWAGFCILGALYFIFR